MSPENQVYFLWVFGVVLFLGLFAIRGAVAKLSIGVFLVLIVLALVQISQKV